MNTGITTLNTVFGNEIQEQMKILHWRQLGYISERHIYMKISETRQRSKRDTSEKVWDQIIVPEHNIILY